MACGCNKLAVACGKKFEKGHEKHLCGECANMDSAICRDECFFGWECRFQPKPGHFGVVDEEYIGGTP